MVGEWAEVRDCEFKFGYIEIQVTPGFSSKAIQLVFGDTDFRRFQKRKRYPGSKVSECIRQLEQQKILCRMRTE